MIYYYANPVLIAAAVIPAVILMAYVYKMDRLEKEPGRLLLSLVIFGILSTVLAVIAEEVGSYLLNRYCSDDPQLQNILMYFVVVGLSEEGAKYLLLKKKTWYSSYFNCQFDGIVYAVFVSLGFALWENVRYVLMYGMSTAILRAFTAVPGHACFGVLMGAWYGPAKKYAKKHRFFLSSLCKWCAVIFPTLLHGLYDYIAVTESGRGTGKFVVLVVVMFFFSFLLVRSMSNRDRTI